MKSISILLVCSLMIWCTCGSNKIHTENIESLPLDSNQSPNDKILEAEDCNQPPYDKIPEADEFIPLQIMPEMIYEEVPTYPKWAEQAGIEGTVWIKSLVLKNGRVDSALVEKTSGSAILDKAALQTAYKNRFKPGIRDGCPVATWVVYKVDFAIH
ncbi:MAG: energy transducer TonB [candidate division Zixibacteria bacterium]|nr:energy transducer TonB [candidate division Zixibacteria bacterium]